MPDETGLPDAECHRCGKPIVGDEDRVVTFGPISGPDRVPSRAFHTICHQRQSLHDRVDVPLEIHDGWVPLVTKLVDDLDAFGLPYQVHQIKEKFGGLRFYWCPAGSSGDDASERMDSFGEMSDLVDKAESRSFHICEVCGEPGEVRGNGWITTRCDEHVK